MDHFSSDILDTDVTFDSIYNVGLWLCARNNSPSEVPIYLAT